MDTEVHAELRESYQLQRGTPRWVDWLAAKELGMHDRHTELDDGMRRTRPHRSSSDRIEASRHNGRANRHRREAHNHHTGFPAQWTHSPSATRSPDRDGAYREPTTAVQPTRPPSKSFCRPATWATWREALAVLAQPRLLRRTTTIALVVGTVLFGINQLDIVLRGDADAVVWVKSAVTYVVPFCVSCAGVLAGTHRPPLPGPHASDGTGSESEDA
jgi:hypothetical protein